jgi:hypothetical protein
MEVFNMELWAIGLLHEVAIEKRDTWWKHGLRTMAVFRESQATL